MAKPPTSARPLSPHLTIWKWGPHMTVSILHRVTGSGMATIGTLLMVWWLAAAAAGPEEYARFQDVFTTDAGNPNVLGYLFGIGLTLALFQHMASGLRHLVMDTGAGFELKRNKTWAMLTMLASVTATVLVWAFLIVERFHG